nr:MAG TPA: hypothetical protein [Caudoviricetes sp.]
MLSVLILSREEIRTSACYTLPPLEPDLQPQNSVRPASPRELLRTPCSPVAAGG